MGIFDFRNPKMRELKEKKNVIVNCNPNEIQINNTILTFPTNYNTLEGIFGKPSRIEPILGTKNNVYLWDDLGIYCSSADPQKMLMLLFVTDIRYGLGHQPINNFKGTVFVDGENLNATLQNVDNNRPYILRSILKEDNQVAIALGWNPSI